MQRKNNILKTSNRGAFAMIMAIGALVVIGGIMALSLSLSTQTSNRTADIYLYEQTQLYAKSAVEKTLLDIAANLPCVKLTNTQLNYNIATDYTINTSVQYIYNLATTCTNVAVLQRGTSYTTVSTPEQDGSVIIDITVTTNAGSEPIRYFRRTIQKL